MEHINSSTLKPNEQKNTPSFWHNLTDFSKSPVLRTVKAIRDNRKVRRFLDVSRSPVRCWWVEHKMSRRVISATLSAFLVFGSSGITALAASPDDINGTTVVDANQGTSAVILKPVTNGKLTFIDSPESSLDVPSSSRVSIKVTVEDGYKLSGIVAVNNEGEVLEGQLYDDIFTFIAKGVSISVYAECLEKDRVDEAQAQIDNLNELIVKTSDASILLSGSNIVSHYGNLYILSYDNSDDAKAAFTYYSNVAEFVDFNTAMIIQDEEFSDYGIANSSECESVAGTNELEKLDEVSGSVPQAPAKTIALIDTGVSADATVVDRVSFIEGSLDDDNGHGSAMYDIIKAEYPEVNILSIKAMNSEGIGKASTIYAAIQYAIEAKVDVINLSISAYSRVENVLLHEAIQQATAAGIVVVGAAGNLDSNAKWFLPGMYDEVIVVGASAHYQEGNNETSDGVYSSDVWYLEKNPDSNYGDTVDYFVDANSTSEASAIMAAYIAKNGTTIPTGNAVTDRFHLRADLDYDEETSMDDPYINNYADFETAMRWSHMNPSNAPSEITENGGGDGDLRIWYSEFIPGASYSTFVYRQAGVSQQYGNFSQSIYCAEAAQTNPMGGWTLERIGGSGWDDTCKPWCGLGPGGDAYDLMIDWWRSHQAEMDAAGVTLTIPATMNASHMNTGHTWPSQATDVDRANRFFYMVAHMCIDRAYTGSWHHLPGGKNGKFDDLVKAFYNYGLEVMKDDSDAYTDWWYRSYKVKGRSDGTYQRLLLGGVRKNTTQPVSVQKETSRVGWDNARMAFFTGASNVNTSGVRYYAPITDATFRLAGSKAYPITHVGSDGKVVWDKVDKGDYILVENDVPRGYIRADDVNFTVGNEPVSLTVTNIPVVRDVPLIKTYGNTALSDSNSNYSLGGAKYELIPTWGTDAQKQTYKFTVTTGTDGKATFTNVPYGRYILHETQASKGCACAPDIYVSVTPEGIYQTGSNNQTVNAVTSTEVCIDDPVDIILKKEAVNGSTEVGDATLAGAEFTIYFYDETNITDDNYTNYQPIFTIVTQTVYKNGQYFVEMSKDYHVGSDYCIKSFTYNASPAHTIDEFYNENEEFLFPAGTVVIKETSAPTGFINPSNLDGWEVDYYDNSGNKQHKVLTTSDSAIVIRIPTVEGVTHSQSSINAFNEGDATITAIEQPKMMGYKITKTDWQTGNGIGQGDATIGPVTYNLTNQSENPVWVDKNGNGQVDSGETYSVGAIIDTVTLNPIKDASGKVTGFETYTSPSKYLSFGTYAIEEVVAGNDYEVGYNYYNNNSTAGFTRTFSVRDSSADVYNPNATDGYVFDLTTKPLIDEVERGGLNVIKYDSEIVAATGNTTTARTPQGDATFAGAEFQIINMSDKPVYLPNSTVAIPVGGVVTTITTDANGYATTGTYVLPIGTYGIKETKAPTGYTLNSGYLVDANGNPTTTGKITDKGQQLSFVYIPTTTTIPSGQLPGCPETPVRGGISVYKTDGQRAGDNKITSVATNVGQGDASLAGYRFEIVNQSANPVVVNNVVYKYGEVVMTITTDENGKATTAADALPYGTYLVREQSQGQQTTSGYYVDSSWSKTVTVHTNGQIESVGYTLKGNTLNVTNPTNQVVWRGGAFFDKIDMDRASAPAQGDATLKGAEISIYNESKYSVKVNGTWYEPGEVCLKIYTDADGRATTGTKILPYGTYKAVETKASTGYLVNDTWEKTFSIRTDGQMVDCTDSPVLEPVVRGDVQITKYDGELNASEATGGNSHGQKKDGTDLSGIVFNVYNASALDVYVDDVSGIYGTGNVVTSSNGTWYVKGALVTTITTHWNDSVGAYTAETTDRTLPYGTYIIEETGYHKNGDNSVTYANEYYLLTDTNQRVFEIRENGKTVTVDTGKNPLIWSNQVVRGDVEFEKKIQTNDERDQSRLWTAWIITNVATGERHAIVTSPNAEFNSSSPLLHPDDSNPGYLHTNNTNGNDWILAKYDADEPIKMEDTDYTCGVWFGLGEDGTMSAPNDKVGALPYGHYTLTEVRSDTNEEFERLISFDFYITRPSVEVDLGTLTNRDDSNPQLMTSATHDETGVRMGPALEETIINDMCSYSGLKVGKDYIIRGCMKVRETGAAVVDKDGNEVTSASAKFTVAKGGENGSVEIPYIFDARNYEGQSVVVFEYLYEVKADGTEVLKAVHTNLNDDGQTIKFPKIGTVALSDATGEHEVLAEGTVTVTDTVAYEGLIPNKSYKVTGTWFDTTDNDEVHDASGKVVTQTVSFTPKTADGTVDVQFTFDATNLAGHTIVCFEEIKYQGHTVAIHANLNDTEQMIAFPKVGTTALFDTGLKMNAKSDNIVINDEVEYSGVIVGNTYGVSGKLVDLQGNPIKGADGKEVTASGSFTATATSGKTLVTFNFDGTNLDVNEIVVFEQLLTAKGNVVAKHEDLTDEKQTVYFPEIGTTLTYGTTGLHEGCALDSVSLPDVVHYKGLVAGEEYELQATLMYVDSQSVVKDKDGKDVVASATFTADASEGDATVTFTFNALGLEGRDVVAFEKLFYTGIEIANHEDFNDENQTVSFPKIETELVATESGLHFAMKGTTVELTDTIAYTNLTPGVEYTAKGHLVDEQGNAVGNEATATFTPDSENGIAKVTLSLDTTNVEGGKKFVAFESVYRGEVLVAKHEDLSDENQTVVVPEIHTTAHIDTSDGIKVTDTVDYVGLIPNVTYTLVGRLVDQKTGQALMRPDGVTQVTATASFVPTTANGSTTVEFNVAGVDIEVAVVYEHLFVGSAEIANHEDLTDEAQTIYNPKIETTVGYADANINMAPAKAGLVINDTVSYRNFLIGQDYVMKGVLFDKTTNELTNITAEGKFKPEAHDGQMVVTFEFDASAYAGHTFVVYEQAVIRTEGPDGKVIDTNVVRHENPDDEAQTIYIPDIKTTLVDTKTQTHTGANGEEVELTDTITYTNLVVGKTYQATGVLHNKATGDAWLDKDGKEVTATAEFTPESTNGTVDVTFKFSGVDVAGKSLVAFETLTHEGVEIAVHADINDEAQTVTFPEIKTNAIDSVTGTHQLHIIETDDVTITVTPDSTANATAPTTTSTNYGDSLRDAAVNASADSTSVNGRTTPKEFAKTVTVEMFQVIESASDKDNTFTATGYKVVDAVDTQHPTVTLEGDYKFVFDFKTVKLEGTAKSFSAIVNCLDKDGNTLKSNTIYLDNVGETFSASVIVPVGTVKVVFTNSGTTSMTDNSAVVAPTEPTKVTVPSGVVSEDKIKIVDTISYFGLVKGEQYSATGRLMDKATGKELTDADGNIFTSVLTFKAEAADGEVQVEFTVPANLIVGKSVVVFEQVASNGVVVATHEDINDENQTLYGAKISTVLTGSDKRSKTVPQAKDTQIVDAITYENLVIGEEYRVVGQIYNKTAGKFVDGSRVESTFKPESTSATVTQTFVVDTSEMKKNEVLVCYETVYDAKGNLVAIHHDMDSAEQSVTVKTNTVVQTGIATYATPMMLTALAMMLLAIMSIFGVAGYRKIRLYRAKRK